MSSNLQYQITPEQGKRARWPHEIFLINLIFNHIFVFCASVAVFSTFPYMAAVTPLISFFIIAYILVRASQVERSKEDWFVKAHWRIGGRRNRLFLGLLSFTCFVSVGGVVLSQANHWNPIATKALIGGAGLLPFMVALLVLIVMGNESVYMARDGKLPKNFFDKNADLKPAE